MNFLNRELIQIVIDNALQDDLLRGQFGLEKENVQVDQDGMLALTPHLKAFGSKTENPYIQTDFSESQIEMITPALGSMEEAYDFMEALQDIVSVELESEGEYLWPSSNPPRLPAEKEIPIAKMSDPLANKYRSELADKYGRKRQLLSGIHYNFSFDENFLTKLYDIQGLDQDFREFKDGIYFKVARNLMRYRWLLIYLTGASPVFDNTYMEHCVHMAESHDNKSYYFPVMNSLRNSTCGYRNDKAYYVSYHSADEYVQDLTKLIQQHELLSVNEFYSPVRIKTAKGINPCKELMEDGAAYLELRFIDINPLHKIGISKEMMHFIHLFILFMLLKEDESFDQEDQRAAEMNQDQVIMEGIEGHLNEPEYNMFTMRDMALFIMDEMEDMVQALFPKNADYLHILDGEKQKILHTELNIASKVKSDIHQSSYLTYHLDKAKRYAQDSIQNGYRFAGYEDLELSTQLLLKAAVKRGIRFQWMDRDENFVLLSKGNQKEYVKQATKTSLDSYSTVLIMENKVVTKKVLTQHGIRVPSGEAFQNLDEAMSIYDTYRGTPIVIKPKSTNFGLGITIFNQDYSREDMKKALEIAFHHDQTVLVEEFVTGKEYRFLVMGDQVVGVLHRVPANVVGDGIHTIEQLVHEKNKDPLRGNGYKTPLEKIQLGEAEEMFLKNHAMSWNEIPGQDEVIYLRENSNISTGGDSIDFTDEMPNSYKELAIQSAKAAGAAICGVDMMIESLEEEATDTNYSIIEINFNPAIHIHCYPYIGKNRKANEKILDLLFGKCDSIT